MNTLVDQLLVLKIKVNTLGVGLYQIEAWRLKHLISGQCLHVIRELITSNDDGDTEDNA